MGPLSSAPCGRSLCGRFWRSLVLKLEQVRQEDESAPESTVQFLHRMAEAVPVLGERLQEHFSGYRRPLAHAFMGQIVFDMFELHTSGRSEDVRPLLAFLESEFGIDEDVDNVISVSFIEMLPEPGERGADIEDLLGPKLRADLEGKRKWGEDYLRELANRRVVPPPAGLDVRDDGGDR